MPAKLVAAAVAMRANALAQLLHLGDQGVAIHPVEIVIHGHETTRARQMVLAPLRRTSGELGRAAADDGADRDQTVPLGLDLIEPDREFRQGRRPRMADGDGIALLSRHPLGLDQALPHLGLALVVIEEDVAPGVGEAMGPGRVLGQGARRRA